MVQILGAVFTCTLISCAQLGLMASIPHEHLAAALALQSMITGIGGSVGQAICGAMWTQLVPVKLGEYLPDDMKNQTHMIYASLTTQLSYPWESPTRQAIVRAYGDSYKIMVIVGTVLLLPMFVWVFLIKNFKLSHHRDLKGTLF